MTKYQFAVIGADNAVAHLRSMERNLVSFDNAFEDIGRNFREQAAEQFGLRGVLPGIRGIPWAPLRPRTVYLRGGSDRQLVQHNRLATSYASQSATGNISETHRTNARFGSRYRGLANNRKIVPIAKFHQEGTRKMTARPVVLGNKQLDVAIVDAFSEQIFSGWV